MVDDSINYRRIVMDEARRKLAELRATTSKFHERIEPTVDALDRGRPEPEPPRRERGLDTAPIDWNARIEQRLAAERVDLVTDIKGLATFLATETAEALAELREYFEAQLAAQAEAFNLRVDKLSKEIDRRSIELHMRMTTEAAERDRQAGGTQWPSAPGIRRSVQ